MFISDAGIVSEVKILFSDVISFLTLLQVAYVSSATSLTLSGIYLEPDASFTGGIFGA